mmetsp:Transcript_551/g.1002  ORF Transcript_551/g.1002 Transcript_551/m.1002 type:complete len:355 (+) Transcript_551:70-1134(+)
MSYSAPGHQTVGAPLREGSVNPNVWMPVANSYIASEIDRFSCKKFRRHPSHIEERHAAAAQKRHKMYTTAPSFPQPKRQTRCCSTGCASFQGRREPRATTAQPLKSRGQFEHGEFGQGQPPQASFESHPASASQLQVQPNDLLPNVRQAQADGPATADRLRPVTTVHSCRALSASPPQGLGMSPCSAGLRTSQSTPIMGASAPAHALGMGARAITPLAQRSPQVLAASLPLISDSASPTRRTASPPLRMPSPPPLPPLLPQPSSPPRYVSPVKHLDSEHLLDSERLAKQGGTTNMSSDLRVLHPVDATRQAVQRAKFRIHQRKAELAKWELLTSNYFVKSEPQHPHYYFSPITA